jgi:hypothetical protein
MSKIFCLLQLITITYGFNIRQSGLQNIITTRAFLTTLTEKINTEIISDNNLLNEISNTQYSHHIENMFYVGMYTTILYSAIVYFTYSKDTSTQIEKLNNIEMFTNTKKRFNMLLIVLILLFTKNIENAI